MTRKIFTTAAASVALLAAVGTSAAFAGDMPGNFSAIDANADGQVTYNEYAKVATANNAMTKTAAAQQFIKISNGNPFFTEADLMTAHSMQGDSDWKTAYQGTLETGTTSTPNTAVLNSTVQNGGQADIPRWSDGTPVDLNAPSVEVETTTTESYDSNASGAYTAPSTTTTTTVTSEGEVMTDMTSTSNPQTQVWSETGESGAAPAPTPDVSVTTETETELSVDPTVGVTGETSVETETDTMTDAMKMKKDMETVSDMKDKMRTTVKTPDVKVEVEPKQ